MPQSALCLLLKVAVGRPQGKEGGGQGDEGEAGELRHEVEAVEALEGLDLGRRRGAGEEVELAAEVHDLGLDAEVDPGHQHEGQGEEGDREPAGAAQEGQGEGQQPEDQLGAVPGVEEDPVELRGVDPEQAGLLGLRVRGIEACVRREGRIALEEIGETREVVGHHGTHREGAAEPKAEDQDQQGACLHGDQTLGE